MDGASPLAVCLQCGAVKHGAWARCAACGHVPSGEEERARALLASADFRDPAALRALATEVRSGEPSFAPEELAAAREAVGRADASPLGVAGLALVVTMGPVLLVAAVLLLLAALLS